MIFSAPISEYQPLLTAFRACDRYSVNIVYCCRLGIPIPVPEEMEETIDEVAKFVKLSNREATHLESFMISGIDITSFGMLFACS